MISISLQLIKYTIDYYAHELIYYPVFIISLLYAYVISMHATYPIALLIKIPVILSALKIVNLMMIIWVVSFVIAVMC